MNQGTVSVVVLATTLTNKFRCVLTFIVLCFIVTYTTGMPQLKEN